MTRASVIAPSGLTVRSLPSETSVKRGAIAFASEVEIEGDAGGGWTKISAPIVGYVCNTCAAGGKGSPWLKPVAAPAGTASPVTLNPTLGPTTTTSVEMVAQAVTTPVTAGPTALMLAHGTGAPGLLDKVSELLTPIPKAYLYAGGAALALGAGFAAWSMFSEGGGED